VLNAPPAAPLYRASGFVHWHFSDVTAALANVCCLGKNGSQDCGARFPLLTHNGHQARTARLPKMTHLGLW
jgi:hypothetical protein